MLLKAYLITGFTVIAGFSLAAATGWRMFPRVGAAGGSNGVSGFSSGHTTGHTSGHITGHHIGGGHSTSGSHSTWHGGK